MKNTAFVFLFFFMTCSVNMNAQTALPQLQAGVYVNDSIATIGYCFTGTCDSLGISDIDLSIDSTLTHLASGVEFLFVVSQLTTPADSVSTSQYGTVHVNDTLRFPADTTHYTFYSFSSGCMVLKMMVTGTPTVPFESYPCSLLTLLTLSNCNNSSFTYGTSSLCSVDDFNTTPELNRNLSVEIYPNPGSGLLRINASLPFDREMIFKVMNIRGAEVYKTRTETGLTQTVDVSELGDGFYFWNLDDEKGFSRTGKLIICKPVR